MYVLKDALSIEPFMERVNECSDSVYFDTERGDHLNLHSFLTRMFLTAVFSTDGSLMKNGYIIFSNPDDADKMAIYLRKRV